MNINSGGPTICTFNLLKGLIEYGVDIRILTYKTKEPDNTISLSESIEAIERPFESRFGYSGAYKIALVKYSEVDIIHANGLWQFVPHASGVYARTISTPFVLSTHGMLYPEALRKSKFIKKIAFLLYQRPDLNKATVLHATCSQEMRYIRSLGIKTPIAIIPNSIEIPELINKFKRRNKPKRVGFIGRFVPIKNIETLIKAWALLAKDRSDCELVLIGDGSPQYKVSLLNLVRELRISNISFPGFLSGEEKDKMMDSLSYLVLPSKSENFGMVVPEALAREVPVIASKGTPWEELNTQRAGWWIDIGVEPLVKALTEALSLPESERKILGQNGRALVQREYSIESVSQKMLKLYNWILNGGEKPDFVSL